MQAHSLTSVKVRLAKKVAGLAEEPKAVRDSVRNRSSATSMSEKRVEREGFRGE